MGSPSPHRAGIRHLPALDGLRGLALLGVLFFHARGALPGGYLGVDLFFVLSGFLITSLLVEEHARTGTIALGAFWVRRARRLMPALLALMPAVAIYVLAFASADELAGVRADALATLGYVANWRAIFTQKSYWELFTAPSPLEHTWSLAIEEQFYVVWPLVVAFVLRRRSPRALLGLTLALAAASIATMLFLFDPASTSRVYLGTDTRAAGILAGAALAIVLPPSTELAPAFVRRLDVAGIVAAAGLAWAWSKLEGENPFLYRGGFWLTEIAALVLVACGVAGRRSIVARALSVKPLTFVGTISYGVYLWHWPVNVVLTADRLHVGRWLHPVQFACTFAIALASYRWLERPIRTRGLPFGPPRLVVPAAFALAVVAVLGATRVRARQEDSTRALRAFVTKASEAVAQSGALRPPDEPVTFRLMVIGDSTANSLGWGLRGVRRPGLAVDLKGRDGCTMLWDTCGGPEWREQANASRANAVLFFTGGAFMHGLATPKHWVKACHPEWDAKFESVLVGHLRELAPRTSVAVVTVPYGLGVWDVASLHKEVDCINADLRKAAQAVPGVKLLDLAGRLCPHHECTREYAGSVIRPDGVHYSIDGARGIAEWLLDEVAGPLPVDVAAN